MSVAFSRCFNNLQYAFIHEPRTFQDAQRYCLLHDGSLANPKSVESLNLLLDVLQGQGEEKALLGLGYYDSLPDLFLNPIYSSNVRLNDQVESERQEHSCLVLSGPNWNLDEVRCEEEVAFFCELPCSSLLLPNRERILQAIVTDTPTDSPTSNPTLNPTENPTQNPTQNPTLNPTHNPTLNPTHNPTHNPTLNPTHNPTQTLTPFPSTSPTVAGNSTGSLTSQPTLNPTENPTHNPTQNPTHNPTHNPTQNPSTSPTLTVNATESPTRSPFPVDFLSECEGDLQYSINTDLLSYELAQRACNALKPGARLAEPTDSSSFNFMKDFYFANTPISRVALLGYKDELSIGGTTNTDRFLSRDGSVVPFIAVPRGQFPWNIGQPDDISRSQDCIFLNTNGLLNDISCLSGFQSICEFSCIGKPTIQPTIFPTNSPVTPEPTQLPTISPTESPLPVSTSQCIRNTEFIINFDDSTFSEAQTFCESLNASLSEIESKHIFNRLSAFYSDVAVGQGPAFVGLSADSLFFNNTDSNVTADCVTIDEAGVFEVVDCFLRRPSVCQRSCISPPSPQPTVSPTLAPTQTPTRSPINFIESACVNDRQYFINSELRNYDDATANCKTINATARLAEPRSAAQFNFMRDFYFANTPVFRAAFLGFKDVLSIGGTTNTNRFLSVDGTEVPFISVPRGQFPWNSDQPDDFARAQDCIFLNTNRFMHDIECPRAFNSICELPCKSPPSPAPTLSPTKSPVVPTNFPTNSPTSFPQSECISGVHFFINEELLPYDTAAIRCPLIRPGARLAEPRNADSYNVMRNFYFANIPTTRAAFLGFRDLASIGGTTNTDRFLASNGAPIQFLSVPRGQFPWNFDQPDDISRLQDCIFLNTNRNLHDIQCNSPFSSICEVPCNDSFIEPTVEPTTPNPTRSPTHFPTLFPTVDPTASPTVDFSIGPLTDGCRDGFEYLITKQAGSFNDGIEECSTHGANVAFPETIEKFERLRSFYFGTPFSNSPAYINSDTSSCVAINPGFGRIDIVSCNLAVRTICERSCGSDLLVQYLLYTGISCTCCLLCCVLSIWLCYKMSRRPVKPTIVAADAVIAPADGQNDDVPLANVYKYT